jgi:hypothetical protein
VKHGKPRQRSAQWQAKARQLAGVTGVPVDRILDVHEEQAAILEYDGTSPADAEWRAWEQTVAIFTRRAA